jgi:hypothetical protein
MTGTTEVNSTETVLKTVNELIKRAAIAPAIDAMQLTQAACNAANTLCSLNHALNK